MRSRRVKYLVGGAEDPMGFAAVGGRVLRALQVQGRVLVFTGMESRKFDQPSSRPERANCGNAVHFVGVADPAILNKVTTDFGLLDQQFRLMAKAGQFRRNARAHDCAEDPVAYHHGVEVAGGEGLDENRGERERTNSQQTADGRLAVESAEKRGSFGHGLWLTSNFYDFPKLTTRCTGRLFARLQLSGEL